MQSGHHRILHSTRGTAANHSLTMNHDVQSSIGIAVMIFHSTGDLVRLVLVVDDPGTKLEIRMLEQS